MLSIQEFQYKYINNINSNDNVFKLNYMSKTLDNFKNYTDYYTLFTNEKNYYKKNNNRYFFKWHHNTFIETKLVQILTDQEKLFNNYIQFVNLKCI